MKIDVITTRVIALSCASLSCQCVFCHRYNCRVLSIHSQFLLPRQRVGSTLRIQSQGSIIASGVLYGSTVQSKRRGGGVVKRLDPVAGSYGVYK